MAWLRCAGRGAGWAPEPRPPTGGDQRGATSGGRDPGAGNGRTTPVIAAGAPPGQTSESANGLGTGAPAVPGAAVAASAVRSTIRLPESTCTIRGW